MSDINFISINENFPAPGEDNDTQTFRDNFDSIKTALRIASLELTDLQDFSARIDQDNDLGGFVIQNATFQNNVEKIIPSDLAITSGIINIEFGSGSYQIFGIGANTAIGFTGFPNTSSTVGKVTLELYGDGTERTITFTSTGGTVFKKSPTFPATLTVTTTTTPIFIEVWQHSAGTIFLNYLGQFS